MKKVLQPRDLISAFNFRLNEDQFKLKTIFFCDKKHFLTENHKFLDFSKTLFLPLNIKIYRKRQAFIKY